MRWRERVGSAGEGECSGLRVECDVVRVGGVGGVKLNSKNRISYHEYMSLKLLRQITYFETGEPKRTGYICVMFLRTKNQNAHRNLSGRKEHKTHRQ